MVRVLAILGVRTLRNGPDHIMNRFALPILGLLAAGCTAADAQTTPFISSLYPIMEAAGCRNCHNTEGVASATRLHFPDKDTPLPRVEAFGRSLVDLVDRDHPEKSLLFLKPTARIAHTGGERIPQNSAEEGILKTWVEYLAKLSGPELESALRYKQEEAAGHGIAPVAVLRRLTNSQYNNTVRDLLHNSLSPANAFPPEDFVNGFKNQYEALPVSPILTEAYGLTAEKLAADAFLRGDFHGLIPCRPASDKDAVCRERFIQSFGRRAFRRPLEPEEVARYTTVFRSETTFLKGAQVVIEAMLQSPNFIFWMEQTPNPKWKPYATASLLSYFLWNTTPDDILLDAAAQGKLASTEDVARMARRMLDDPRAKDGLDEFSSQWLRFDRAIEASRERRTYPLFNRELTVAMTEEAKRFVGDLVWNDRNFMQVFTADYGFPNSDLAAIYKVSPPMHDYDRVTFSPESERAGLLGQALFLTLTSKPDDTAPTGRGLFVREQFLCQQVPPPPPNVDTNLPAVDESRPLTNRERLAAHTGNKVCAGCHNLTDQIGFGLEKFDAIGMRREQQKLLFYSRARGEGERREKPKEVLLTLDTTAHVAGVPNSDFTSARQLGDILARTPQCQECIVKQVFRYMAGRLDTPADRPVLNRATEEFRKSNFNFRQMVVALIAARQDSVTRSPLNVASNH
jgi:Protein of unknown function (DUF1592)/Protein of unknown function (DUF1588)/Protein of unknown function (DUF1587)/Protein of unknown function (DUF1595)/Protein of unknown function (DUF1585)